MSEMVTARRLAWNRSPMSRNIYKYYVSYRLTVEAREAGLRAREEIKKNTVQ